MFYKKLLPLIFSPLILSACGGSDEDSSTTELPSVPPVITASFAPIIEKSAASLAVTAQADGGTINQYSWQQTSGPTLDISGADTANISFTAPMIAVDTPVEFTITVTDSNALSSSITATAIIERIEASYTLMGMVAEPAFAGGTITASVADEVTQATIDDQGNFNVNLMVDDDVSTENLVKLTAHNSDELELVSLLSSLATLSDAPALLVSAKTAVQKIPQDTTSGNLSVSSVSTALYSLLMQANDGLEPSNMAQMTFAETQVDPDALTEAAAVVKLIIDDESVSLPEGVTDIVSLLTDNESYNALVETIEETQPELIQETVAAIIDDPNLTPTITVETLPEIYYQTSPVAPTFVARFGGQYQFAKDMTGQYVDYDQPIPFTWNIEDNAINLEFDDQGYTRYWHLSLDNIPTLTQEQLEQLQAANSYQVEVTSKLASAKLNLLTSGNDLDTYRVINTYRHEVTPVTTEGGTITLDPWEKSFTANQLMQKSLDNAAQFTAADMQGQWGIDIYNSESWFNNRFEIVQFSADGSGISLDSNVSFAWSIDAGVLSLSFSDFTQSYQIISSQEGDLSIYSKVTDKNEQLLTVLFGFATQIDAATKFTEASAFTGPEQYWQTMVNQWLASQWDGDTLIFCAEEYILEDTCHNDSAFGFQIDEAGIGSKLYSLESRLPPNFTFEYNAPLSWSLTEEGKIIHTSTGDGYQCDSSEEWSQCRFREWKLLKTSEGRLGTRIYVQEVDWIKYADEDEYYQLITPRWNMYELIDIEYFNDVAKEKMSLSQKITAFEHPITSAPKVTPRLILNPSQSMMHRKPVH